MSIVLDQETASLDIHFGQILQLGTTRCDDNLNVLEEFNLRSRRQPWVIPSPAAMLITKVTPDMIESGPSYFDMLCQFNDIARGEGVPLDTYTYNGMRFDDPGLRVAFDQNLLQSDFTRDVNEDGGRNRRIDVMVMVQGLQIHAPDAINLDATTRNGSKMLRLGVVCRQNGIDLAEDAAHEALADNHGTIGIAKLIQGRARPFWDHMMDMTTEEGARGFLSREDVVHYTEFSYGKPQSRTLTHLCAGIGVEAGDIGFDLSHDPEKFMTMDTQSLVSLMKSKGRGNPFVDIRSNQMPILLPLNMIHDSHAPKESAETLEGRAKALRGNAQFMERVKEAARLKVVEQALSPHIEKQTDYPLPDDIKERLIGWRKEFYHGDWDDRAGLVDGFKDRFAKELEREPSILRYKKFGQRILFDNAPELLGAKDLDIWKKAIAKRVLSTNGPQGMVTIPSALDELDRIRAQFEAGQVDYLESRDEERIDELDMYLQDLQESYQCDLS